MLSVVSDNSLVKRIAFVRTALTDDENEIIIKSLAPNKIIQVNAKNRALVELEEDIDEILFPNLKNELVGPFTLSVSNNGDSIRNSVLTFELKPVIIEDTKIGSIIINTNDSPLLQKSIGALPFLDIFGGQIEREIERASSFLTSASKGNNTEIERKRLDNEKRILINAAENVRNALDNAQKTYNNYFNDNVSQQQKLNQRIKSYDDQEEAREKPLWQRGCGRYSCL